MATAAFQLTSLMYGGRHTTEVERSAFGFEGMWPAADRLFQLLFGYYQNDETEARVPGADQIVLLSPAERKRGGVFVPLDESGAPRLPEDKLRLLKQDRAAREAGRLPKTDYTVIWLPRYWKTRIQMFILAALTIVSIALAVGFFVPLVVGRAVVAMISKELTHDGYNIVREHLLCSMGLKITISAGGRLHLLVYLRLRSGCRKTCDSTRQGRSPSPFASLHALQACHFDRSCECLRGARVVPGPSWAGGACV